jgi:hypothetical protein
VGERFDPDLVIDLLNVQKKSIDVSNNRNKNINSVV